MMPRSLQETVIGATMRPNYYTDLILVRDVDSELIIVLY